MARFMALRNIYILFIILSMITSCDFNDSSGDNALADSLAQLSVIDSSDAVEFDPFSDNSNYPEISYKKIYIEDLKQLLNLKEEFKGEFPHKLLITLNRKEFRYFRIKDTIIVPDTIVSDIRAYSLFPQNYDGASSISKIILISNKYQAYACYEFGKLVRFAACNSGKERTPTFPGRYAMVWKERVRRSSLDSNWVMPFTWNFHAEAGNAFHQFDMPGRPVSHSCVRQFMSDAEWLYTWGEGSLTDENNKMIRMSGCPVIILDIFDFSRNKYGPWIDINSNKFTIELPKSPLDVEEALIPWCQIPDASKWAFRGNNKFIYAEDTLRARGIIRPHVKLIETVNFNKLRRQKAAAAAKLKKAEELKKKELEKKENISLPQLKDLDNSPDTNNPNSPRSGD